MTTSTTTITETVDGVQKTSLKFATTCCVNPPLELQSSYMIQLAVRALGPLIRAILHVHANNSSVLRVIRSDDAHLMIWCFVTVHATDSIASDVVVCAPQPLCRELRFLQNVMIIIKMCT